MREGRKYKSFPNCVLKNKFLIHTHPHPLVQLKKNLIPGLQLENTVAKDTFSRIKVTLLN